MARLQYDDYGWLAVLGTVFVVEYYAPPGKMLSHGAARYRAARPAATTFAVWYLSGHLLGYWPERLDGLSRLAKALGRT